MKQLIERTLIRLVGQPLWAVGRAGLVWFQFGQRRVVTTRQGDTKEVGAYALHLQCPWSWSRSWGEVIADCGSDSNELSGLPVAPVICESVEARLDGSFRLVFDDYSVLVVEPRADEQADEYWRFFEPQRDTPHFVVGPKGVET